MSHHGDGVLVFALGKALLLYLVIELGVHLYRRFIWESSVWTARSPFRVSLH